MAIAENKSERIEVRTTSNRNVSINLRQLSSQN